MLTQTSDMEKYREVLRVAEELYNQDPDWVTFFREVMGIDGVVRTACPSLAALGQFARSEEFEQIQKMLVKLREKRTATDTENEPTRVITVRLPKSMHEYLRTEAHDMRTSMNKLCISKLLLAIGEEFIPSERSNNNSKRKSDAGGTSLPSADRYQSAGTNPLGQPSPPQFGTQ